MSDVNWEMIIFIIIAGLIIFAGMGIFIGTRISSDKRRIRELEDELAETKKTLEAYRAKVNTHFRKTSELFSQMTDSYKAIYLHLAEGSQELCTTDAALLKPANVEFMKVTHEERSPDAEERVAEQVPGKPEPAGAKEPVGPEAGQQAMPQQGENVSPDQQDQAPAEEEETSAQTSENAEQRSQTAESPVAAEERKEL